MIEHKTDTTVSSILIADDKPENLRLLSGILTDQGYEVRSLRKGTMVVPSVRNSPPDLILLDIMMPDMNGYDVCRQLKSDENARDIPVIFISALDEAMNKTEAFSIGGVDYITKPFQEEEVLARVKNHLALRTAQKRLEEKNARLRKTEKILRRDEERLNILFRISQMNISHKEIASLALEEFVRLTCSEIGYLHFVNSDQNSIALFSWSKHTLENCAAVKESHYPLNAAGIWADCIRDIKPVIHNDYAELPDKKGLPAGHVPVFRHMSVPIFDQGRIVAIAGVGNKKDPYDETDANQLLLFTRGIWEILQRKQSDEKLREAKEAAEAANRAKSEFLANMSHELRTPLNAVIGFSQLMACGENLTKEQQENLRIINRSGEHLLTLINSVLDMSKIEAGRTVLIENDFDLNLFLDDLKDMFRIRAAQKDLHLSFERRSDVPGFVRTDEAKLRQVLINLIGNALKFTQIGGITVKVGKEYRKRIDSHALSPESPDMQYTFLRFAVEDTGPGIAQEEISTVFEPFMQTETGRQSQEGTGLGLPISRKFVQLMSGDIAVCSEVNKGSVFTFHIRAGIPQMPGVPVCESPCRVIGTEPGQPCFRILIADDNADNRLLLTKLLAPLGFELREAENGKQAVEIWEQWQPHLIWMDKRMPVLDGYKAAKRIRTRESEIRNQNPEGIPDSPIIIAVTASAFDEDRTEVLNAGCNGFLRKPFKKNEIFDLMHKYAGIKFMYAEAPDAAVNRENRVSPEKILTPQRLSAIPETLREEMLTAAAMMSIDDTESAVIKIREHDSLLADALDELLSEFRFEIIENVLKEIGK